MSGVGESTIEVTGEVQLEAVRQAGEIGLRITDLGVAATVIAIVLIGAYMIARQVIKSLDKRQSERDSQHAEERKTWQDKDEKKAEMMLQVISENSSSNKEASLATKSLENLIVSIERTRLEELQRSQSSSRRSSDALQKTELGSHS